MNILKTGFIGFALMILASVVWANSTETDVNSATLSRIADNISDPYALYFFSSLNRHQLWNEITLEKEASTPEAAMSEAAIPALNEIFHEVLVDPSAKELVLDVRKVATLLHERMEKYLSPSDYWPNKKVTPKNRAEHIKAYYSAYLLLVVANATSDEILKTISDGMFARSPDGDGVLQPGNQTLIQTLKDDHVLSDIEYKNVMIERTRSGKVETLTMPEFMNDWRAKITAAFKVKRGKDGAQIR